MNHDPAEAT